MEARRNLAGEGAVTTVLTGRTPTSMAVAPVVVQRPVRKSVSQSVSKYNEPTSMAAAPVVVQRPVIRPRSDPPALGGHVIIIIVWKLSADKTLDAHHSP